MRPTRTSPHERGGLIVITLPAHDQATSLCLTKESSMRIAMLLASASVLLLSACAAPAPRPGGVAQNNPVVGPTSPRARCDASGLGDFVGRTATTPVIQQAGRQSGAATTRVIRPGQAVTMDFREDRLNIEVDATQRITRVHCG